MEFVRVVSIYAALLAIPVAVVLAGLIISTAVTSASERVTEGLGVFFNTPSYNPPFVNLQEVIAEQMLKQDDLSMFDLALESDMTLGEGVKTHG